MNGPTPSWHRGTVFKTSRFLRPAVIMKILGRRDEMTAAAAVLLAASARDLTSVRVCMLPAYNYPLPACPSFVCRLNTIMETLNTAWQTSDTNRIGWQSRQSTADIISARKGKLNICPYSAVQCLSQTGVRKGEARMGKYVPIYIEAV